MFTERRSPRAVLLVSALAALAACGDRTQLTNPLKPGDADRVAAAPANSGRVKIKTFQLSSNTLGIDGAAVTGNVSLGNSGAPIDGVAIRGQIVQGSASRQATLMQLNCAGTPGTLPNSSCDLTFNASASNLGAGSGTLVPGSAVFILDVVQTDGATVTVLATKSLNITLVLPLGISSLTLNSTTLLIGGPSVGWTATITNPGSSLHGVFKQGLIIQGATEKGAGGATITCGGGLGVLPSGTCTFSFTVTASNSAGGTGTLVPGPATFRLQLLQSDGTTTTVLDTRTVAVTLAPNHPVITSVTANPQTLAIDGPTTLVTVVLDNPTGAPVSGLRLAETIVQGTTTRAAGGTSLSCGAGDGVMPAGTCTMNLPASASNSAPGSGTLTASVADLSVALVQATGGGDVTVDTKSYSVGLLPPPTPVITDASLSSQFIVMDGPALNYSVSLKNQNINTFTSIVVQVNLVQGGVTLATTSAITNCGGLGQGVLPTGTCTVSGGLLISSGIVGLNPGDATIEIKLFKSGAFSTDYDSRTFPITVVGNTVSIASLHLQSSTITIGSFTDYTVTISNPTNSSLSLVFVQGEMLQGASTVYGAGGTNVVCGAGSGVLPPGLCTFQFSAVASNSNSGIGTLVPGPATFRLTLGLFDGTTTTTYDVKSVPVTLVSP